MPDRQRVRVELPGGVEPLVLRYLWTDNPEPKAIMRDGTGLPAHSFRTGERVFTTEGKLLPLSVMSPALEKDSTH